MPENQIKAPELEQTSEEQSLISLIKELHLPDEVIWGIEKLTKDNKEICILMLKEIQEDLKSGKIVSFADATDKAKSTLTEYGVKVVLTEFISKNEKNEKELKDLSENLTKVKSLDPVVEDELQKAKGEKPNLPPELTKAVADKTGVNIENLEDITTKWWEKQQDINNMIDTYYLANIDTTRITELLKWKKSEQEINESFATLRNSARHLDIPVYETARNISKLIPDLTDKTQESVISTVTSLTASKPDTVVTRTGDTLRFTDPKNEKYSYEIDLEKQPPRLAKSLNWLSISRDIRNVSPEEQAKKDKYEATQKQLQKTSEVYNTATTQFWWIRRDEYTLTGTNNENIYSSVFLSENRDTQWRYEELEWRLANSETPRDERWTIIDNMLSLSEEMKSNNLSKLLDTWETENHGKIDKMIEWRREHLRILKDTLRDYSEAEKIAKTTPKPQPTSDDTFDEDAGASLSFLVENGLHHLGQQWFEELMNAWNRQHLESKNYQINLQDSPRIGTLQKKEFWDFMRKRYGNSEWTRNASLTQEKKNLTNNDFRATNWTDIKNRQDYLFGTTQKGDTAKNIPSSDINNSAENGSTQGEVAATLV
jgi:hypothetical protein